jgi:L-ascorbate metabolism protein UlaG (beta-lactamase superfamily)
MNIKIFLFTLLLTVPIETRHDICFIKTNCFEHSFQPIIKNGYYFNDDTESRFTHVRDAAKIFFATKTSFKKYFTDDITSWIQHDPVLENSVAPQLQWIGHASFLIQINGFNILTDPIFYDLDYFLYPRKTPVGIQPKQLPRIDFVIISHNHRDHLDEASMKVLKSHQPIMLVPAGTQCWFLKRGFKTVIEHQWWQQSSFERDNQTIECTFVPAVHWSGRTPFDAHASLWGGWLIKAQNKTIYFAGDTGFNEFMFKAIADYAKTIDYALLPIGPCEPRSLMHHSHIDPEEAVAAFKILNPTIWIPMHWGTFRLGPDSFDDPIKKLDKAWQKEPADIQKKLYKIKFGERISF